MKKIILLLTLVFLFISCGTDYPQYSLGRQNYLPDENKEKLATFIKETVSATNLHMTGGDYEDPEDVIEEAEEAGRRIYEVETDGLYIQYSSQRLWDFIPKHELTPKQKIIYENLTN